MKSYFIPLDACFPTEHRTNFLQCTVPVRRILAHICQIKWNLISFDNENDKKTLNNFATQKQNLSIYSLKIHDLFVLCGGFQRMVVVKMLLW